MHYAIHSDSMICYFQNVILSITLRDSGAPIPEVFMMACLPSTTGIKELGIQVESFLSRGMLQGSMTKEEIRVMKEQECIEVTVHGKTTEMVSIKKLEERFKDDYGSD